jgi:hypothetical protein
VARPPDPKHILREEHAHAAEVVQSTEPARPIGTPGQSVNFSRPPGLGDAPFVTAFDSRQHSLNLVDQHAAKIAQKAAELDKKITTDPGLEEARKLAAAAKAYEAEEKSKNLGKDDLGKDEPEL